MVFLKEELTIFLSFIAKYTEYYKKKKSFHVLETIHKRHYFKMLSLLFAAKKPLDPTAERGGTTPPLLNL